jgi:hypothetical protein
MGRQTANSGRQPNDFVRQAAQAYNETYGFKRITEGLYVAVDESRARRIADVYEALPSDDSGNPVVREAYHQLAEEIQQQWNFARVEMGITFEPWMCEGQPYANSGDMCGDVRNRRRLYFFQGGDPHPLLGRLDPATGLSLNDKFRAIHDLFGHAAEGYGFGPRGEENAWIRHCHMFRADAQKALTTETRGQNCWGQFWPA